MELEEWLRKTGRQTLAKLAEDMPGGSHGVRKPDLIDFILSDKHARAWALESKAFDDAHEEAK